MPRADMIRAAIATVFPEWSSTRMAKWLGVNPRTLQRWMAAGDGTVESSEIPEHLIAKIRAQAHTIEDIEMPRHFEEFISNQLRGGVDPEVLAAWLAWKYKALVGRDID